MLHNFGSHCINIYFYLHIYRSICPEEFCKKGVFKNFAKFAGKYLCWSLILIRLQV